MRFLPALLAVPLAISACRSKDESAEGKDDPARRRLVPPPARAGAANPAPVSGAPAGTNAPAATTVLLPTAGRVHKVNPGLRFVVLDYTLGNMPPLESRLRVYRDNQRVGLVRLSGPSGNGFVVADIVEGFIQVDDQVRFE